MAMRDLTITTELAFEIGDRLLEHAPVRRRGCAREVGPRTRERELDRASPLSVVALGRGQRAADRTATLRLRLLKLDVLAFKPSRHGCY